MIIDAHHHLWHYTPEEFDWISPDMAAIRRDFLPADLDETISSAGVDATIAVQARQSLEETRWLLDTAAKSRFIRAVVGWAPLTNPHLQSILEPLAANPRLRALRHVIQGEPDGFMLRDDFNHGISALALLHLRYDLLIFARQLPEAIQFVDRHPKQIFILDHIAKPDVRNHTLDPWRSHITDLARRPNVYCKISGMVTEADWQNWTPESLHPYANVVLEAFTPRRLMFGSDWPVSLVASSYNQWLNVLGTWIKPLSPEEQRRILGETAAEAYGLTLKGPQ